MKQMLSLLSGLLFIASLYTATAHAGVIRADDGSSGFYLGGELAGARLSDDGMANYQSLDNHVGAIRMFGGYEINHYLAAEVALDWLGTYEAQSASSDIYNDYSALSLSLVGKAPLGNGFSLYGQVGAGFVNIYQDITAVVGPNLLTGDHSDTGPATLWGAGLSFIVPNEKQVEIRVGMQRIRFTVNAYTIDSLGNVFRKDFDQQIGEIYVGAAYHF